MVLTDEQKQRMREWTKNLFQVQGKAEIILIHIFSELTEEQKEDLYTYLYDQVNNVIQNEIDRFTAAKTDHEQYTL